MSTLRSLLLLLVCAVVIVFIGVNWGAMNQPMDLSLVFTQVHAPLGLILLGLMAVLAAVFVAVLAYGQWVALIASRRHARELAAQRELAERAEASRLTELRTHLDEELRRVKETVALQGQEALARIDRAEVGLREPLDNELVQLTSAVQNHNRDLLSRVDRLEIGLRERPLEAQLQRLADAVDAYNQDLHSRVDRLEMGLIEGLAGYIPSSPSVHPAVSHDSGGRGSHKTSAPSQDGKPGQEHDTVRDAHDGEDEREPRVD